MKVVFRKRVRNTLHWWEKDDAMIHTGLSVVVCGHRISIVRDEDHKIATVVVLPMGNNGSYDADKIHEAATTLMERAKRFLGREWTIKAGILFEGER